METHKCLYCGRDFSRKEGLSRHINCVHLNATNSNGKNFCTLCNDNVSKKIFILHLVTCHNFKLIDAVIESEILNRKKFPSIIPIHIVKEYLSTLNLHINSKSEIKYYERLFVSFYKLVTKILEFDCSFVKIFVEAVLPWKLSHPKSGNNKELPYIIFPNDKDKADKLYRVAMLEKNPYYLHDGTTSVFSLNYKGYLGLSDDEKRKHIYKLCLYDKIGRNRNLKEYWIKRGYSTEDAITEAKKYINVFSLEKCIERYGEEEGRKRFKQRQEKWQNTLKSKSIEELKRINHSKVYKRGSKSGIEHEFLMQLDLDETKHNVYLPDLGIVDFIKNNKIIEFYGDYWHCNPQEPRFADGTFFHCYLKMTALEKWEFDSKRIKKLIDAGYNVKIVWEHDYIHNKDEIIQQCLGFLND